MGKTTRLGSKGVLLSISCAVLLTASMLVLPIMNVHAEDDTGTLRIAVLQDTPDFNIFNLGTNSVWKNQMFSWAFEGLAGIDIDNEPYPLLAQGWSFYEDTLTVEITLRQDVTFHDGLEMTADDVVFTFNALRGGTVYSDGIIQAFDQNGDYYLTVDEMASAISKTGDYSLVMHMAVPYGQFFSKVLTVPIIPQHIWEDHIFYDGGLDVFWNDPAALIGTGPFVYSGGVPGEYRLLEKYDGYWGKGFMTPSGYSTYPPNVNTLRFGITYSMESSLSDLTTGDADYVSSAVPADMLTMIDSDPSISIDYIPDAGYFYLAFNEKREPFGSLAFRKAVSHLIDKEHIVDVYMGGLGVEGSSAVPPYFDAWHDGSVTEYVYDDPSDQTTTIPEDILDAAGLLDFDGDGWRDLPDGTPMDKIIILAPPADYDPIRIRSAEAIANNLVAVGLNAEAVATDFNTLVSKLTSFEYQMLILGWTFSGYTECVSLLFDIYGPMASSNSWGFWSDSNPSPWYSSLGGVSTLADAETQALVDQLYELELEARSSFIVSEQIELVKQGQEIVADAVPCNVLYHRVNAQAHRDSWTGWVPHMGTLFNMFSLSELVGGEALSYDDAVPGVNVGLSAQRTATTFQTVSGHVLVIDDLGDPVPGASVTVSFEPLSDDPMYVHIYPTSGTTSPEGVFEFTLNSESEGYGALRASAAYGAYADEDSMTVSISRPIPTTLSLSAHADPATVRVGEPATISLTVTDETGMPVEGAEIAVDTSLLGVADVSPSAVLTDASGQAAMTFIASSIVDPAGHDLERVLLSVSKDGYAFDSSAYLEFLVYNDADPDWLLVNIDSVTTTALGPACPSATVTVSLTDDDGTPKPGETLHVMYSDDTLVSAPVTDVITDANGLADIGVTMLDVGVSCALRVAVGIADAANAISDTVTFTYLDPADPPASEMYGGYAQYATPKFVDVFGTVDLTFHVFDSSGAAADGITGSVLLSAQEYGQMTDWSGSEYNTLYDYAGMNILTAADGVNILSAGPYSAPEYLDYWAWDDLVGDWVALDIHGVDIVGGVYSMTIEGVDLAHLDQALEVHLCPDSTADLDWYTWNHVITGETTISSSYGYGRSYEVVSVDHAVSKPVMTAYNDPSLYDTSTVTATVVDQDGAPVEGCDVLLYDGLGLSDDYGVLEYTYDPWSPTSVDTGPDGTVSVTVLALPNTGVPAWSTAEAALRAVPSMPGAISLMSESRLFIHPRATTTVGVPILTPVIIGGPGQVQAMVATDDGLPLTEITVGMTAGTDETVRAEAAPDDLGVATFAIDTSRISSSEGGFVPVLFASGGPGYEHSSARLMVPVKNPRPEIVITEPSEGEELSDATVTIRGYVTDTNGISSVTVALDGTGYAVPGNPGDAYWTFEITVSGLADGTHHVTVDAADSLGVCASAIVSFEVAMNYVVVVKLDGGPEDSIVSKVFRPATDGIWTATVENYGLRGLVIDIYDITSGEPVEVAHMKLSLAKYPAGSVVATDHALMSGGHGYLIVLTPIGPEGGSATVTWYYAATYSSAEASGQIV